MVWQESFIDERRDEEGIEWKKVCYVGKRKLEYWKKECQEFFGIENVKIEKVNPLEMECFENNEEAYRIWVRKDAFLNVQDPFEKIFDGGS